MSDESKCKEDANTQLAAASIIGNKTGAAFEDAIENSLGDIKTIPSCKNFEVTSVDCSSVGNDKFCSVNGLSQKPNKSPTL